MTTELSQRAAALLARLRRGDFYRVDSAKTPKAMAELLDAGLVTCMVRVETVAVCYVSIDHTPFKLDRAPGND